MSRKSSASFVLTVRDGAIAKACCWVASCETTVLMAKDLISAAGLILVYLTLPANKEERDKDVNATFAAARAEDNKMKIVNKEIDMDTFLNNIQVMG